MRFIRIVYFLFAFSSLLLVLAAHVVMAHAGDLPLRFWIVSSISLALFCYFGYFSYKAFRTDFKYARGAVVFDRRFPLKMSRQDSALIIGPIAGEGRCQLRLHIRSLSRTASRDEFHVVAMLDGKPHGERDTLPFTSGDERFEVNVDQGTHWNITIEFRPVARLNDDFSAEARLIVFGVDGKVTVPDRMITIEGGAC